jgi:hypothetical protein
MPGKDFLSAFSGTLGDDFLGPEYYYQDKIASPKKLGMSPKGDMTSLGKDVDGIIAYVELLVEGGGKANLAGKPLGDRFFLKTASKCKDVKTEKDVTRYHYINNQIDGNITLPGFNVSTGMKGLIPGVIADTMKLNPLGLLKGFVEGDKPWCKAVTKKIINNENQEYNGTHHVALTDLPDKDLDEGDRAKLSKYIESASANDKKATCEEGFVNIKKMLKEDPLPRTYVLSVSLLLVYILYKIMNKK